MIENYQILQKIGQGGNGEVYLVRYRPTGQIRVAKRYRADHREGCLRELRAMRHLNHPSLPGILDVIRMEDTEWLVMEYISGRCLNEMPRKQFSLEQFFEIAEQLAEVLIYLHGRIPPVLHLDIKPGNLIWSARKKLILLDFGAAVMKNQYEEVNPCMGTPGFAAPEQGMQNVVLDGRADIYGFGAVLNWYFLQIPENTYRKFIPGYYRWKKRIRKIIQKCMQSDRTCRYRDSKILLHVIRRERWKVQVIRRMWEIAAAMIFLVSVLTFAGISLSEELRQSYRNNQNTCAELLRKSELLGFSAASEYYREAALLFPEQTDWWLHLIERIDSDTVFDLQEELLLKELLFQMIPGRTKSVESMLSGQDDYLYAAFRTGMSYWYYYEGNGGKNAAVHWFEKVMSISDSSTISDEWKEAAKLYIRIQKYYEQRNTDHNSEEKYSEYWRDLKKLWDMGSFEEDSGIQLQMAEELVSGIVMYSAQLVRSGQDRLELETVVEEVKILSEKENESEHLKMMTEKAKEAINRAYQR